MIAFFLSPLGRGIGIAAAIILALTGAWSAGYRSASRQCQAEALRSELASARADLDIARKAASDARQLAEANDKAAQSNMERVRELEASESAKAPAAGCPDPFSDGDYDRLRRIR